MDALERMIGDAYAGLGTPCVLHPSGGGARNAHGVYAVSSEREELGAGAGSGVATTRVLSVAKSVAAGVKPGSRVIVGGERRKVRAVMDQGQTVDLELA